MHAVLMIPRMGKQWRLRRRPGKPKRAFSEDIVRTRITMQAWHGNEISRSKPRVAMDCAVRLCRRSSRNRPDRAGRTTMECSSRALLAREQPVKNSRVSTHRAALFRKRAPLCDFHGCGFVVELAPIHARISLSLLPSANCFFRASALMPANSRTR